MLTFVVHFEFWIFALLRNLLLSRLVQAGCKMNYRWKQNNRVTYEFLVLQVQYYSYFVLLFINLKYRNSYTQRIHIKRNRFLGKVSENRWVFQDFRPPCIRVSSWRFANTSCSHLHKGITTHEGLKARKTRQVFLNIYFLNVRQRCGFANKTYILILKRPILPTI